MTTIGRWSPNKVRSKIIDAQWVSESRYALELIAPSSVVTAGTGSSATVSALGSVEFTSCETLNGVFSSGYDNYMLVVRHVANTGSNGTVLRLRVGGTDASGSNYTRQYIEANSTTVSAARDTTTSARVTNISDLQRGGDTIYVYGPNLAQPTAFRNVGVSTFGSAGILDYASTHSLSTAYDGFTYGPGANNMSGRVAVYGMRG
jgi:hypothetical protein